MLILSAFKPQIYQIVVISLTHLMAGLSIAYIVEKRLVTSSVFAVVPDFDITFNFLYPFVHRGIMHSFMAALTASFLVYVYSEDRISAESCFLGYSTHLFFDTFTRSGVTLFFPIEKSFALNLTSATALPWNLALISIFLGAMMLKKNNVILRPVVELR